MWCLIIVEWHILVLCHCRSAAHSFISNCVPSIFVPHSFTLLLLHPFLSLSFTLYLLSSKPIVVICPFTEINRLWPLQNSLRLEEFMRVWAPLPRAIPQILFPFFSDSDFVWFAVTTSDLTSESVTNPLQASTWSIVNPMDDTEEIRSHLLHPLSDALDPIDGALTPGSASMRNSISQLFSVSPRYFRSNTKLSFLICIPYLKLDSLKIKFVRFNKSANTIIVNHDWRSSSTLQ